MTSWDKDVVLNPILDKSTKTLQREEIRQERKEREERIREQQEKEKQSPSEQPAPATTESGATAQL